MTTLKKPLVVQAAVAALFAAASIAPAFAADATKQAEGGTDAPKAEKKAAKKPVKAPKTVHCLGVNSCKGSSECGVEGKTSCKGHNACKGQGWISLSKKDCKKQGGTVVGVKSATAGAVRGAKS